VCRRTCCHQRRSANERVSPSHCIESATTDLRHPYLTLGDVAALFPGVVTSLVGVAASVPDAVAAVRCTLSVTAVRRRRSRRVKCWRSIVCASAVGGASRTVTARSGARSALGHSASAPAAASSALPGTLTTVGAPASAGPTGMLTVVGAAVVCCCQG